MMQNSSGIGRKGKIISNVQITKNVLELFKITLPFNGIIFLHVILSGFSLPKILD